MKACSKCAEVKPLEDYYKHPTNRDGRFGTCKPCVLADRRRRYEADGDTLRERVRDYRQANPERVAEVKRKSLAKVPPHVAVAKNRRYNLKKYGLTIEQFDAMFAAQGERCALCRSDEPGRFWTVDHDHTTGKVRGVLCWHCNVGLGHFRDDAATLIAAADYVMRAHETPEEANRDDSEAPAGRLAG